MSTPAHPTDRPHQRRLPVILTAAAALVLGVTVPAVDGPADAADGRVFRMTEPVPERGYFLPGDRVAFEVVCLDGEDYERVWIDELGSGGWAGGDGWGQSIDPWAQPGTHEVVLECTDSDGDVVDSETFSIEVGAATSLVATVGTVAGECATTDEITVEPGTEVHWCYRLVPDPTIEDDLFDEWSWDEVQHRLADTLNGTLGTVTDDDQPSLPPEGITSVDLGIVSGTIVTEPAENTGTWSVTLGEFDDSDDEWTRLPMADVSATARVLIEVTPDETPEAGTPEDGTPDTGGVTSPAPPATPVTASPNYTG